MNIEQIIKLGLALNLEGCVFILSDNKADGIRYSALGN